MIDLEAIKKFSKPQSATSLDPKEQERFNREYILLATEAIPALISEVSRLTERVGELEGALEKADAVVTWIEQADKWNPDGVMSMRIVEFRKALAPGEGHPAFLDCGKCPWNINGIHDEMAHY